MQAATLLCIKGVLYKYSEDYFCYKLIVGDMDANAAVQEVYILVFEHCVKHGTCFHDGVLLSSSICSLNGNSIGAVGRKALEEAAEQSGIDLELL